MMNEKGYDAENLQALATFLAYAEVDGVRFDMGRFSVGDNGYNEDEEIDGETECGSVGCSVGHASLCFHKPSGMPWGEWANQMFIQNNDDDFDVAYGTSHSMWDWAFAADWQRVDNTRLGAAKRIQYLLDHNGIVPRRWRYSRKFVALYQSTEVKREVKTDAKPRPQSQALIAELIDKINRQPKFRIPEKI